MNYRVNGLTGATLGTDAHAILQVWNPSSIRAIALKQLGFNASVAPAAGAGFVTRRSTARGTAGSTITPTLEHHTRRQAAPDSGFLVDLAAFSVQPTLAAGELDPFWIFPAVIASGIIVPINVGLEIPPGTGLVFVNRAAIIFPASEFGLEVEEL